MATPLSELVHFIGEETALVSRVRDAVEWMASKPEGLAILEEARALHGKPLDIITDSKVHYVGYGDHAGNHVVFANPILNDSMAVHGQNGEIIRNGLERFFSHEFKHAAQPDVLEHARQYAARRQEIIEGCFPQIPLEQYIHRMHAVKHDTAALRELLGEIYDAHIGPRTSQITQEMIDKIAADPAVKNFAEEYEVPAIEFENLMMGKYKGEPGRTLDYANSASYDELLKATDRDGFIESALTSFHENVAGQKAAEGAQAFRGGERTEPLPRTGGWAETC